MIISISGPERSGKDLLGCKFATEAHFKYPIKQGFGNMHLYHTSYPWHYMPTADLLDFMIKFVRSKGMNTLFYISEADKFLGPRGFKNEKQTEAVNGLSQGEKRENVFMYNFHPGDLLEPVHGVDLQLRSVTGIKIVMKHLLRPQFAVHYILRNVMLGLEPYEQIDDCHEYLDAYDHKEHIV